MKWVAAVLAMCAGCDSGAHAQPDALAPDARAHASCSPISMLAGFGTTLWNMQGGSVKITAPATFESIAYYDIREGSFAIAVTTDASADVDVELVSEIAGNRAGFVRNGAMLELHRTTGGVDAVVGSVPYDATNHKYLRFGVTGGVLAFAASPDGTTFSDLGTADAGALTFVQVAISFPAQASAYNATLENANGTATGAACPIAELADDFSMGLDKWARSIITGGSLAIVDGAVHLSFVGDGSADTMGLAASTVYDVRQSALTLEIPQMVDVATMQQLVVLAESRAAKLEVEFVQTHGMLTATVIRAGVPTKISTNAYDPIEMRWWRLHAATTSMSWEVSPDRNAWTQLAEVTTLDGLDTMDISITAQGTSTTPDEAIVDNVGGL